MDEITDQDQRRPSCVADVRVVQSARLAGRPHRPVPGRCGRRLLAAAMASNPCNHATLRLRRTASMAVGAPEMMLRLTDDRDRIAGRWPGMLSQEGWDPPRSPGTVGRGHAATRMDAAARGQSGAGRP